MTCEQLIQLISSVVLVLLTGALVWATWTYVKATKKIADAAIEQSKILQKDFEIRYMPITEERVVQRTSLVLEPEVEITIFNKGLYPVLIKTISYEYYHSEHIADRLGEELTIESWLPSGKSWTRKITIPFANILEFNQAQKLEGKAFVLFEFKYLSIENKECSRPPLSMHIE